MHYNKLVMNSQQQQSDIAQQNMLAFYQEPSNSKYVTYFDMQKYETQNPLTFTSYNIPIHHQGCTSASLLWDKTMQKPPPCIKISQNNSTQWVLDQGVSLCCLSMKLQLHFRLRRNSILEIAKYRRKVGMLEEEGLKYQVENRVSTMAIKIFIVKGNEGKIWKEIQTPITSYEPEALNHVQINESANGDIFLLLNGFQFMFSLRLVYLPGLYVVLRTPNPTNIEGFCLQLREEGRRNQMDGCTQDKCLIF